MVQGTRAIGTKGDVNMAKSKQNTTGAKASVNHWQSYTWEIDPEIEAAWKRRDIWQMGGYYPSRAHISQLIDYIYAEQGRSLPPGHFLTNRYRDPDGQSGMVPLRVIVSPVERSVMIDVLTPELDALTDQVLQDQNRAVIERVTAERSQISLLH
jgi:hypothetical protein